MTSTNLINSGIKLFVESSIKPSIGQPVHETNSPTRNGGVVLSPTRTGTTTNGRKVEIPREQNIGKAVFPPVPTSVPQQQSQHVFAKSSSSTASIPAAQQSILKSPRSSHAEQTVTKRKRDPSEEMFTSAIDSDPEIISVRKKTRVTFPEPPSISTDLQKQAKNCEESARRMSEELQKLQAMYSDHWQQSRQDLFHLKVSSHGLEKRQADLAKRDEQCTKKEEALRAREEQLQREIRGFQKEKMGFEDQKASQQEQLAKTLELKERLEQVYETMQSDLAKQREALSQRTIELDRREAVIKEREERMKSILSQLISLEK